MCSYDLSPIQREVHTRAYKEIANVYKRDGMAFAMQKSSDVDAASMAGCDAGEACEAAKSADEGQETRRVEGK